jgi:hypothetical protein
VAWFPHYEEILIIPTDNAITDGMRRETANAFGNVLRDLPDDFGLGSIDAPIFHIRPRAQRTAQMAPIESQNYRGLLERGGLKLNG